MLKDDFIFYQTLDSDSNIVVEPSSQRVYLTTRTPLSLQSDENAAALGQVLNHPNLVSLVGRFHIDGFPDQLVWDYCDQANLAMVFMKTPRPSAPIYFLPEALCWHVMRSLLRAVTHLHDGKRLVRDASGNGRWVAPVEDWRAILHRNIRPENVFLQSAEEGATYGPVKLGDFSQAMVTSHMPAPPDLVPSWPTSVAMTIQRGHEPLQETMSKFGEQSDSLPPDQTLYTLSDEIFSIGSLILTMMTTYNLQLRCQYGCSHVARCNNGQCIKTALSQNNCQCIMGCCQHLPKQGCRHPSNYRTQFWDARCNLRDLNLESWVAGVSYSAWIRNALDILLESDPTTSLIDSALRITLMIEQQFDGWRANTGEGANFVEPPDSMGCEGLADACAD
ncbi:hypothetical protein CDD81_5327 [Ophiocordyceps australis]|uniref:non-specific serine/threonine protein kinase n=1 Tax=Ophiocordyceps australis TaxID=1399860 RepID=A0A2C5XA36_9HYPO|nr:hypothetical protein CDD81_5327 [Ophiocordyceps australis]